MVGRLALGLARPWGSVVAMSQSSEETEQLSGFIKPASRKDGPVRKENQ